MDLYDSFPIEKGTSIYIQLTNKIKEELQDKPILDILITNLQDFGYESLKKIKLTIDFGIEIIIPYNDFIEYNNGDIQQFINY